MNIMLASCTHHEHVRGAAARAAASAHAPPAVRRLRNPTTPPPRQCHAAAAALSLDACTVIAVASNLDTGSYELGQAMNTLVAQQLTELSPATCGAVLLAGLATSVSPCTLSVLPLTIGYIGGYTDTPSSSSSSSSSSSEGDPSGSLPADAASTSGRDSTSSSGSSSSSSSVGLQALCFSLGLASSLAGLGVAASGLGRAYGAIGPGLPTAVALVAILMGLNLLQVVQLPLPSFLQDVDVRTARLPPPLTAYLAGATFALAASPCSTPVLATILAYASTQASPGGGGLLLFLYSCGYVVPLLAAASATGAAKRLLDMRAYSAWVTPASGVLLVGGGTYALLSRLLPAL